jgi:hypothetical protein
VGRWLDELQTAVETQNISTLIRTLQRIVPEYQPSDEVRALCQVDCHDVAQWYRRARAQLWYPARQAA